MRDGFNLVHHGWSSTRMGYGKRKPGISRMMWETDPLRLVPRWWCVLWRQTEEWWIGVPQFFMTTRHSPSELDSGHLAYTYCEGHMCADWLADQSLQFSVGIKFFAICGYCSGSPCLASLSLTIHISGLMPPFLNPHKRKGIKRAIIILMKSSLNHLSLSLTLIELKFDIEHPLVT